MEENKILKFIGCGSAFNVNLGNNNAYIKRGNSLFLIDCGGVTFNQLIKNNIINGVENIYVVITHTHSDHIGSLGDLIAYCYYILKKKVNIIFPDINHIKQYLNQVGMSEQIYNIFGEKHKFNIKTNDFNIDIEFIKVKHVSELKCYGYIIRFENKIFYYSGDSLEITNYVLNKFYNNDIEFIYQDTSFSTAKNNPHLNMEKLCCYIKEGYRERVFCMHLDEKFDYNKAKEYGFNVVNKEF